MPSKVKKFTVSIPRPAKERYPIFVGNNLTLALAAFLRREARGRKVAIITHPGIKEMFGASLRRVVALAGARAEFLVFPAGERNKNQATVTALQHALLKRNFCRDTLIIALGGGVVGDVAGFVAATYLRGVPYIHVPTTLLAMVDSSIGGKTGIDTPVGKNLIGAFWQPEAVFMDTRYVVSLPREQLISGLLEAIKTFITSERAGLAAAGAIALEAPLSTMPALQAVIERSVKIKSGVVARDEKEINERRILNFGHTIGHALEKLSGYRLPHGFAVGYGMIAEVTIAERLGILPAREADFVFSYLEKFGITSEIFRKFGAHAIVAESYGDKKVRGGRPYYVLLRRVGAVYKKHGQFAHPVPDRIVLKVLRELGCK